MAKKLWSSIISEPHSEVFTVTGLTNPHHPVIHASPCFGEPNCDVGRTCCGIGEINPRIRLMNPGFSRIRLDHALKVGAKPCGNCFIIDTELSLAG